MRTYNDLNNSTWLNNANLTQLRAAATALGIPNFPMNRNTIQTRAAIRAFLQANPQTALPTQNVPWPQSRNNNRRRTNTQQQQPATNFGPWPWIIGTVLLLALIVASVIGFMNLRPNPIIINMPTQQINVTFPTPLPPTQQPIVPPTPTAPAQPPAGPSINSALTINEFARMWSAHPVSEGPGPLMEELNSYFDNGGWQFGGQYSGQNGWDVPAGSVVWTDLLDQSNQVYYVGTTNPVNTTNDFVRLRCQGNWCVFYAYAAVRLPTPGRYLITDPWLNPANDLAGWLH